MYIITKNNIEICKSYEDLKKILNNYINNNISYYITSNINKINSIKKELSEPAKI